jgi:hypothetical protein
MDCMSQKSYSNNSESVIVITIYIVKIFEGTEEMVETKLAIKRAKTRTKVINYYLGSYLIDVRLQVSIAISIHNGASIN